MSGEICGDFFLRKEVDIFPRGNNPQPRGTGFGQGVPGASQAPGSTQQRPHPREEPTVRSRACRAACVTGGRVAEPPVPLGSPGLTVTLLTRRASWASPRGHGVFQAPPPMCENMSSKRRPFRSDIYYKRVCSPRTRNGGHSGHELRSRRHLTAFRVRDAPTPSP